MRLEKESFEEAQKRILGKAPSRRRQVVRSLKQLDWWKILRSAFFVTIFFLFGVRRIFDDNEAPIYVFFAVGLTIFVIAIVIFMAVQLGPLESSDEET